MRVIADGAQLRTWWENQPEISEVRDRIKLAAVLTDPSDPWVQGLPAPRNDTPASYFTDASIFAEALKPHPVVIWGPGTPAVMHADNEYVELAEITECVQMYSAVVDKWDDTSWTSS